MIDEILQSQKKIYLAITGGGTKAISQLLENGGASSVFVGARIPYSPEDLSSCVGFIYPNDKCCSKKMAERMAHFSMCEAFSCNEDYNNIVGLGCTATLCKKEGEREGRVNQAFICVTSKYKTMDTHIEFINDDKHRMSRLLQEDMLSTLILSALADFVKSPPKYINSHIESNPYVRIQWQGYRIERENNEVI